MYDFWLIVVDFLYGVRRNRHMEQERVYRFTSDRARRVVQPDEHQYNLPSTDRRSIAGQRLRDRCNPGSRKRENDRLHNHLHQKRSCNDIPRERRPARYGAGDRDQTGWRHLLLDVRR